MSLNVYLNKNELPVGIKYIKNNDLFFNGATIIDKSDFTALVLKTVDKAERVSDSTFIGRTSNFGSLFKNNLSTGTKTLLNIHSHPDICFDVLECGDNALEFLCDLHRGNIVWSVPFINFLRDDESCDIQFRGRHFDNIIDFMDFSRGKGDIDD
jgi:hypothetical protein